MKLLHCKNCLKLHLNKYCNKVLSKRSCVGDLSMNSPDYINFTNPAYNLIAEVKPNKPGNTQSEVQHYSSGAFNVDFFVLNDLQYQESMKDSFWRGGGL